MKITLDEVECFITSQGDTAPKLIDRKTDQTVCFITSQGDTAPKPTLRTTTLA